MNGGQIAQSKLLNEPRIVQVDSNPEMFGRSYRADLEILCDAGYFIRRFAACHQRDYADSQREIRRLRREQLDAFFEVTMRTSQTLRPCSR